MSYFLIISFVFSLLTFSPPQNNSPQAGVFKDAAGRHHIRSESVPISGPKGRYHSLSFSLSWLHHNDGPIPPKTVKFELVSVVKARRLNPDLYVVFVLDGKEIHFSSNRSAIRRPVRGKPWIGERMVFSIPYEQFDNMTKAKTLSVKLGTVTFDFSRETRLAMGEIHMGIRSPFI